MHVEKLWNFIVYMPNNIKNFTKYTIIYNKMRRKRSISSIIDDKTTVSTQIAWKSTQSIAQPKRKQKVPCFCSKCNGKLVESCTKIWHELDKSHISNLADKLLLLPPVIYLQNELPETLQNSEIQEDVNQLTILNEQKIDKVQ